MNSHTYNEPYNSVANLFSSYELTEEGANNFLNLFIPVSYHEVSESEYKRIERFFSSYIFRREEAGSFYVKVTASEKIIIKQQLKIELK